MSEGTQQPLLALAESSQPNPTGRTFTVKLPDGDTMHISFTTVSKSSRHHGPTLHRPCNRDVNIALQQLSSHQPLKDY